MVIMTTNTRPDINYGDRQHNGRLTSERAGAQAADSHGPELEAPVAAKPVLWPCKGANVVHVSRDLKSIDQVKIWM